MKLKADSDHIDCIRRKDRRRLIGEKRNSIVEGRHSARDTKESTLLIFKDVINM